jgi:hypothetical protein
MQGVIFVNKRLERQTSALNLSVTEPITYHQQSPYCVVEENGRCCEQHAESNERAELPTS